MSSNYSSGVQVESGGSGNNLDVFKKPKGIMRIVELLLSLIAFAALANVYTGNTLSNNNTSFSNDFNFQLAANILAFCFAFFFIICYIFRDRVEMVIFFLSHL